MEKNMPTGSYHLLTDPKPLDFDTVTMLAFLLRLHRNLTPDRVFLATDKRQIPANTGIIDTRKYCRYGVDGFHSATEAILEMEGFKPTPPLRDMVALLDKDSRARLEAHPYSIPALLKTAGNWGFDRTEMLRQAIEVAATLYLHLEKPLAYDDETFRERMRAWMPEIFNDFDVEKSFMSKIDHVVTVPGHFIALVGRMTADEYEQRYDAVHHAYAYWKSVLDAPACQQRRKDEAKALHEQSAKEARAREGKRLAQRALQLKLRLDDAPVMTSSEVLVSSYFEFAQPPVRGAWTTDSNAGIAYHLWPLVREKGIDLLVVINNDGDFDIRVGDERRAQHLARALKGFDRGNWQHDGTKVVNRSPSTLTLQKLETAMAGLVR